MSNSMHGFEIEAFGLTSRQAELFLTTMQGILHELDAPCTPEMLVVAARDYAIQAHEDRKMFGGDLGRVSNDTAELPLEFEDLAEVLERLTDWQAQGLLFFAIGFWRGIATAHEQAATQ